MLYNVAVSYLPPSNSNLDQIFGVDVGKVGCMEVGSSMHTFVEILLLNVGMSINMNDADIFGSDGC